VFLGFGVLGLHIDDFLLNHRGHAQTVFIVSASPVNDRGVRKIATFGGSESESFMRCPELDTQVAFVLKSL
jgi:hypothetical protein